MRHARAGPSVSARRARHALNATAIAAVFVGLSFGLAVHHQTTPALIAALIAAALVISALVWALKQEERR